MKKIAYISTYGESEKLIIRAIAEEDFEVIAYGLNGQGKKKNRFDEEEIDLALKYTKDFCKTNVRNLISYAEDDKAYMFRAFKKEDNSYIGGVIIKTILRKNFQWAEIGYWLLNQHWGQGYGSEMLKAGIDIAFNELGFHRLEAHINLDNIASQKTAEKAGMKLECIRENFIYEDEKWTDNMIYVINKNNKLI